MGYQKLTILAAYELKNRRAPSFVAISMADIISTTATVATSVQSRKL
jgi:hypothetical protein